MADELSDAEVFGAQPQKQELSDADVFGSQPASAPPGQQQAQYVRQLAAEPAAAQELTQKFAQEHPILENAIQGATDVAKSFLPKIPSTPQEFLTDTLGKAFPGTSDLRFPNAAQALHDYVTGKGTAQNIGYQLSPEYASIAEAEKTPAFSRERFAAGLGMAANLAMIAGLKAGFETAPITESVVRSELERPPVQTAREPAPQNLQPKVEPSTQGGEPNASQIESTTPPDGGVRARSEVGQLPQGNVEAADARLRGNAGEVPAEARTGTEAQPQTQVAPVPEGQQAPAVSTEKKLNDLLTSKGRITEEQLPSKTVSPEASAATKPTAAIPAEAPAPTGISEARTEAELGKGSVEPGVGAELGSGLEFGRKYINEGKDPRLPIRRAQASGMVGVNEVGVVHAELERLRGERSAAARALEADPTNPELQRNFEQADNAQRAWRKELQPVLTKAGDALREAYAMSTPDADPATYQGLADLFDEHFKGKRDITPEMRTAMSRAAKGVQEARASANGEMAKVEQQLQKQMRGRKVMTPDELDADLKTVLENEFKDCILA